MSEAEDKQTRKTSRHGRRSHHTHTHLEGLVQRTEVTFQLHILFELFILLILLQEFADSFLDFILPKRCSS